MKALWLENGDIGIREVSQPDGQDGEAVVRVLVAGICNTDLELVRGYYPYDGILGHEFVGEVSTGPAALVGRRVVGEINAICGSCAHCMAGRPRHCSNRTVMGIVNRHGAFAEYLALPSENLHPIPDQVTNESAVFVEPLAAALEIQEQHAFEFGERVLVIGDGKLGQLIARTLTTTAATVTVLGHHIEKLARLADADVSTDPDSVGDDFDVVVECTGNADGFSLALDKVRARGTLIMKSTYQGELTFDAAKVVVDEVTLLGSRCGPFERAIAMLGEGRIDVSDLVTDRFPLDEAVAAFERASEPGVMKVMLEP